MYEKNQIKFDFAFEVRREKKRCRRVTRENSVGWEEALMNERRFAFESAS